MRKSLENVKTELEIHEHLNAHRQGFVAQRVGLSFIMAIVLAAALGVFGDGWLSNGSVSLPFGSVEFEKFYRHEGNMNLTLSISKNDQDKITVSFPSSYLKSVEIKTITPGASSISLRGDMVDYTFKGNGTSTTINFTLVPREVGRVTGQMQVNNAPVTLTHFIYP